MQPVTCKIKRNFTDDIHTRSCISCVYLRRFLGGARSCKAEGIISLFVFNRYTRYEELFGSNFGMRIIAKQTAEFMEILLFSLIELVSEMSIIIISRSVTFRNETEDQLSELSELEMCSLVPLYLASYNTIW
jgi:hypothetical protein